MAGGRLGVIIGDARRFPLVGEHVVSRPGTPHTFWNAGEVGKNGLPDRLQIAVSAPPADVYAVGR